MSTFPKFTSLFSKGATPSAGALLLLLPPVVNAQQRTYAEYPQRRGLVEQLRSKDMPTWLTIDGEVRGRTEGQTSYAYAQNGDRTYELTRLYIGMEVRPNRFLTGYLQAIDTHALGLPLHATGSNMRDVFDDRQAYLRIQLPTHDVPVQVVAGRQELRLGASAS